MSGYTVNSIVIKKDIEELFSIINYLPNWPILHNYEKAEMLEKKRLIDGRVKIEFQLTAKEEDEDDDDPKTWKSHRVIDKQTFSARGVRLEPMFPFKHWILDILLSREGEDTRMTWIQDFAIDPKTGHTDEEIEGYINKGSKEELEYFKAKIESGEVKDRLPDGFFN